MEMEVDSWVWSPGEGETVRTWGHQKDLLIGLRANEDHSPRSSQTYKTDNLSRGQASVPDALNKAAVLLPWPSPP